MERVNFFSKASGLSGERFHTRRQTRHFPRSGVFVQHAFGDATHDFWLGFFQRSGCCGLIARGDGLFDAAQVCADARAAGFVNGPDLGLRTR